MSRPLPCAAAIVVLGGGAVATARRIQALYVGSRVHGLAGRTEGTDVEYREFGDHLRRLYRDDTPIVALCAAGIVIRTLAPLLAAKGAEPPVLAVAEDGTAVVPLLGGLGGVNDMARSIAEALAVAPAITTSGELRFGTCLLDPPSGYTLTDIEQGKRFVSDLLGGERVRVEGEAPWLASVDLPRGDDARRAIRIDHGRAAPGPDELRIYPRDTLVAVGEPYGDIEADVREALAHAGVADPSLACLLAAESHMAEVVLHNAARALGVPLRFAADGSASGMARRALPSAVLHGLNETVCVAIAEAPLLPERIGRRRGRLSVIGLGPGDRAFMIPAVQHALAQATDVLGYETYVRMAGPFRDDQVLHCTDNREEMQRARHAFELAATGGSVVVVSSGDPGVFAMAAAVLEALHVSGRPDWHAIDLQILPGVSASLATAAQAGAPLGHDFCMISLSDNLKPWSIIEQRLDLAARADLALAFYNPISRARPWQLGQALDIVRRHRAADTPVTLGRDIGRPGQSLRVVTLGELLAEMVDMRTMVLVGSSTTCTFPRADGGVWVYTPRWYGGKPVE